MKTGKAFSFDKLITREAAKQKKRADLSETRIFSVKKACVDIMPMYKARRAWLFGSTIEKNAVPASDIDIMV